MLKIPGPIPITIYPFFWIVAAGISWLNAYTFSQGVVWMFVVLFSVLIHEYGHALSALAFGQKAQIQLVGFGGVTQRQGKSRLWQEFIIVLNGPLAGLLFCGAAWWAHRWLSTAAPYSLAAYAVSVTFYVNLFWTFVNLLPIQPLDGGKLLAIALEALFGLRGTKIALFISLLLAGALGLFLFAIQAFLAGSILLLLAYESFRSWKQSLSLTKQDQNFILQHLLKDAEHDIQKGEKDQALIKLQRVRDLSGAGVLYLAATEEMAHLLAEKECFQEAYQLLEPYYSKLKPESLRLLHQLAYHQGKWQAAIAYGDKAYRFFPSYDTALINALCHSELGHVHPAIGWLKCAIREGIPNLQEVLDKPEFDSIRNDPQFQQITVL